MINYPHVNSDFDNFKSNRFGNALGDVISARVTEERNGIFDLELEYPYNGERADMLVIDAIVSVPPCPGKAPEPFRIYAVSRDIQGVLHVLAHHIIYDTDGIVKDPVSCATAGQIAAALTGFGTVVLNGYASSEPYTLETDVPMSLFALLGKAAEVMDAELGYEYDAYNQREVITLYHDRGKTSSATVAYGVNLIALNGALDASEVYTAVMPYYWKDPDYVTLPERTISTGATGHTRILTLDLTSSFESTPTQAELRAKTNEWISAQEWTPEDSVTFDFVPLANTTEYAGIQAGVNLCDTLKVDAQRIGVVTTAKVVKAVYDPILDKYTAMTVGKLKTTIADTIAGMLPQSTGNVRGSAPSYGGIAELWTGSLSNGNSVTIDGISDYTLFIFRVTENALPIFCAKLTTSGGNTYIRGMGGYSSGASSELAIYVNASLSGNTMTLTNCHGLSGTTRTAKTVYKIYGIV